MIFGSPTERLKHFGFEEEKAEERKDVGKVPTGFPKPLKRVKLVYEAFDASIEEMVFFMFDYMRYERNYPTEIKLMDLFTASEQSAFFGAAQQRLGIQQDKVSQFLATIGKMVKELFQLVRELRIIDERLGYYKDSYDRTSKSQESAEITLKGIWIDMVEQGAKNPASVYGMARELQFTTLPDLFFKMHPQEAKEVDEVVDILDFNRKVKEVLKRKLRSYLEWKEHTYRELKTKRIFTLKYLRQHYEIIRMYMNWVKPYLKNIRRLQLDSDRNVTTDLIAAFESSVIEIEVLYKKKPVDKGYECQKVNSCVLLHWIYFTKPSLNYQQAGYQSGPIHIGQVVFTARAYAWKDEQINKFIKMREDEELELLTVIDESVRAAMEALGDELVKYLRESEKTYEEMFEEKKDKSTVKPVYEPFSSALKGFGEMFGIKTPPGKQKPKKEKVNKVLMDNEKKICEKDARDAAFRVYNDYKKTHDMLTW